MGATMTIAEAGWGHWGLGTAAAPAVSSDVKDELYSEKEIRSGADFEGIVGQSVALRQVLEQVETVAGTDSTVLLLGETGTGKELIARALHLRSHRKARPSPASHVPPCRQDGSAMNARCSAPISTLGLRLVHELRNNHSSCRHCWFDGRSLAILSIFEAWRGLPS